ncbi:PadR family transcriptional regulator [Nocardioides cynanchi]|uniref:PadR family transcriptional regulator n=1 Tax=Nocardioides cynanchi TaxID=2558918 RepID=UPI001247824B|nr:PadR family transcriptional regulator [Nocardioides cynanchi]
MGEQGFGRQWAREFESRFGNHQAWQSFGGRGGPWGGSWGPQGRSGPPPWLAGLFGLAGQDPPRGPRVRRGDVRVAILAVLADEPLNGYQVIGQIAERSGGAWRPSPGSVYPTISQLEDEGLIEGDDERGRRTLRLTADGRTYLADHADEVAAVWAPFDGPGETGESGEAERSSSSWAKGRSDFSALKPELGRVMNAVWQIISTGTDEQRRAAIGVLVEARRGLYGILADHPGDEIDEIDDLGDRHDPDGQDLGDGERS